MSIISLATALAELDDEISELEMDMFSDEKELKQKENQKRKVLNELLFYDEFEELYENSKKYDLDVKLLYPFKESIDREGNKEFVRKSKEEYKEDVDAYLEELQEAYHEGKIDKSMYKMLKGEAIELANKQIDRIEEEEKEQEKETDLKVDYGSILESIENTKHAFIVNQIGEESYGMLSVKYKHMPEVDRKILLEKTHVGLCNEMGITCDFDFTKYDLDESKTVNDEGYCIKSKDINNMPFPLDTMILEQAFKLHIKELLASDKYTLKQKEQLKKMLFQSLENQKKMILDNVKKRELKQEG